MKKAGILTFQFADNYGALLQAYALQQTLSKEGIDTSIINYRPIKIEELYSFRFDVKNSIENKGFIKTLSTFCIRVIKLPRIIRRRRVFGDFRKKHLNITKTSLYTFQDLKNKLPKYDYYFVGSDQVWNPDFIKNTGTAYFLDFAGKDSKKISYAASVAKNIEDEYKNVYMNELTKFNHLSVREESARVLLSDLTNLEIKTTLDPTLLITKEEWKDLATATKSYDEFILVYDLELSETIIDYANALSDKTGYKIISYTGNKKYKNHLFSFSKNGPSELLKLFTDAKYVITSSFHGTAFSVIFEKNFFTIPHTTRGSRMIDFLKTIGLENRIITYSDSDVNLEEIDYEKPNKLLNELRNESISFIRKSLK